MKHILVFIDSLGCGGAEKSLISLLPFLASRKYNITLMVRRRGGIFECFVPDNIQIKEFPHHPSKIRKFAYSAALRLFGNRRVHTAELYWKTVGKFYAPLDEEYDVAIAYQQGFPTFFIAEKVKAKKKLCWVNADLNGVGYSDKFCRYFYDKYNRVVAVSDSLRDDILYPNYVSDKSRVITCRDILNDGVIRQMSLEVDIKSASDNRLHITTVGRLVPLKGYDLAIHAARILKEKGVDFIWHFVGGGILYEKLRLLVENEDLSKNIILEGEQLNPYPFIAAADIYVQTSRFEGFGLTIGEAKILGKPVVSTNFPVVYNQISDGKNGLVVEMCPQAIAEGIMRLVANTELRTKIVATVSNERNTTAETESKKVIELIEEE